MKNLVIILLITLPVKVFCQLLLNSGEEVSFKKFETNEDHLTVKTEEGKIDIPIDNVLGFMKSIDQGQEKALFNTSNIHFRKKLILDEIINNRNYTFATLVSPGKINIYLRIVYVASPMPGMNGGSRQKMIKYYYLKRDDVAHSLMHKSKKEKIGLMNELFADDQLILSELNRMEQVNDEKLVELVKEYNVKSFTKKASSTDETGKITFYRIKGGKHKAALPIRIDEVEVLINPFEIKLVELSADNPVKICIGNESNKYCELMIGSLSYVPYFEIKQEKNGKVEIINRRETDAFRHIKYIRSK